MAEKIEFEKAMERLEEINDILENGKLKLDESISLYEEATKLSKICYKKLDEAKQKVEEITEGKA